MNRFCMLFCITLFGSLGWWLGERFGLGTAFLLSSVGSFTGIYVGWRINRDLIG